MNGRLYDPIVGRMLSPDPYVQMPDYSQNFNRYSYVLNNPLKFTDPSGEFVWVPVIIGAALGAYTGYKIADANGYDFGNWQTYGYMFGGAVIGGISGYAGAGIAASGGFMANTMGMVGSSYFYSVGMAALSGGMTDVNVSFGVGSYNITQNEFSYFLDGDNEWYQDIGYAMGGIQNANDLLALLPKNSGTATLRTQKDFKSHSQLEWEYEGESYNISIGNGSTETGQRTKFFEFVDAYDNGIKGNYSIEIKNINLKKLTEIHNSYQPRLGISTEKMQEFFMNERMSLSEQMRYMNELERIQYHPLLFNCSQHVAVALNRAGRITFPSVWPHALSFQLNTNLSWYLYQY